MQHILLLSLFVLVSVNSAISQVADVTKGCNPLSVQFESDAQSKYFWDFGDGDSSDKQNPQHIYVSPGAYEAKLYTEQGGEEIGSIAITVYDDITIDLNPDSLGGCNPFNVTFSPLIDHHPEIQLTSYLWSFGDGGSSAEREAKYSYKSDGIFTVSLEVSTSIGECDKTIRVEDLIKVENVYAFFRTDKNQSCEYPVNFYYDNFSDEENGYSYEWDFGNGKTSNVYSPDSVLYENPGTYIVELRVNNGSVCTKRFRRVIEVGDIGLSAFDAPEAVCQKDTFKLIADASSGSFDWDVVGQGYIISSDMNTVQIVSANKGTITVTLEVVNDIGCVSKSTQIINVIPDASFVIEPNVVCEGQDEITLIANNKDYQTYVWTNTLENASEVKVGIEFPERDSFFINEPEEIELSLIVISTEGCTDTVTNSYESTLPEAYFIPNQVIGIAPLAVTFMDYSESATEIVRRGWDYNDGSYEEHTNELSHSHVFSNPGKYFVKLDVENENQCVDTSKGVWITVLDYNDLSDILITPDDAVCNTGFPDRDEVIELCVGTELTIEFIGEFVNRGYSVHFNTDDGRFNFCWETKKGSHVMKYPGLFPLTATVEYEGFILDSFEFGAFLIKGAKPDFSYTQSCSDIGFHQFSDASINADSWKWYIDDKLISEEENFDYRNITNMPFEVTLEAANSASGCTAQSESVTVSLNRAEAKFDIPDIICSSDTLKLDASNSTVDLGDCSLKYEWIFENNKNRIVSTPVIEQILKPGMQDISLVVSSDKSCSDTLTLPINVFDVKASFEVDSVVCLPQTLDFQNRTESIASISSYEWSFDSDKENPSENFVISDTIAGVLDVFLVAIDSFGCVDTFNQKIEIYDLVGKINIDSEPIICEGSDIEFSAILSGQLDDEIVYNWSIESIGEFDEKTFEINFDKAGMFPVKLNYSLEDGSCSNYDEIPITVIPPPQALMSTSVDNESPICYPKIIEFQDVSNIEGAYDATWVFDNNIEIVGEEEPTFSFDKGIHSVQLIVESFYGCSDTLEREFELVSPEGTFNIDIVDLCFGDEFTVSLNSDTVDVYSYVWDMGDGTIIENTNPASHTYLYNPEGNRSSVDLILRAAEEGCEIIESVPLNIFEVLADFEIDEELSQCNGEVTLSNTSLGGSEFEWYVDGVLVSKEDSPTIIFSEDISALDVQLVLTDFNSGCESDTTITLTVNNNKYPIDFPNVFSPNNDNVNDHFNFILPLDLDTEYEIIEFKIYNRWGNLVYDNDLPDEGWDGKYNGENAPSDVYAYYIEVVINGCVTESMKGNVTIVR